MKTFATKRWQSIVFGIVVLFVVLLRFVPISFGDMYNDGAHYSFRSFGWFDWMGQGGQSTPFEWFDRIPPWARLSFHDAPPLAFLIQNIFFKIFGGSVIVARLPFVLAGIGSMLFVYFLLKKQTDKTTATRALILYSFVSYGVWVGQAVFLEGIEVFFIVGSVFFGSMFLFKSQESRHLYGWSIFTACAILVKYTAVFLLPPIILYLFFYRGKWLNFSKRFIVAAVLFLLMLSPVIVYNINMYQERGHFDAALSSMLGMRPDDFILINDRTPSINLGGNLTNAFFILAANVSFPLLMLFIASLTFLCWRLRLSGLRNFEAWILCNMFFLLLMFAFGGPAERYLAIIVPLLVIIVSFGAKHGFEMIKNRKFKHLAIGLLTAVFIVEFVYSVNTNLLNKSFGTAGYTYSVSKIKNLGFNQLDNFVRKNIITELPEQNKIRTREDINFTEKDIEGRSVVVFDDRINWFAQMWYMQKYLLYYRWPVISTSYISPEAGGYLNLPDLLSVSGKPAYFIYPIDQSVIDLERDTNIKINAAGPSMAAILETAKVPVTIIKNRGGIPVFKVYKIEHL